MSHSATPGPSCSSLAALFSHKHARCATPGSQVAAFCTRHIHTYGHSQHSFTHTRESCRCHYKHRHHMLPQNLRPSFWHSRRLPLEQAACLKSARGCIRPLQKQLWHRQQQRFQLSHANTGKTAGAYRGTSHMAPACLMLGMVQVTLGRTVRGRIRSHCKTCLSTGTLRRPRIRRSERLLRWMTHSSASGLASGAGLNLRKHLHGATGAPPLESDRPPLLSLLLEHELSSTSTGPSSEGSGFCLSILNELTRGRTHGGRFCTPAGIGPELPVRCIRQEVPARYAPQRLA